ncbi:aspartate kinase [Microbulbifer thermotolerans]|uniref:aspartate kinase n=1 Tax=Microbulbifer thermotolerans TaxID=252514 RepID=A0AB35HV58_MICTH|nr:aspartate kinase [Microbulbifer thermotolerans]MCX2780856.1 aspartate kinase [Microbulbifer thermotolerans]MCX2784290.1 aspartate kinase [Microbulbifer thermotolerans]MCX2794365.1 aspartate kinase [Microbulbifer thermotolerans]MCX2801015.1 aspartate kinase [Microbulbifer thermotolerans]MCX2804821.1 aspartate kinase [Microbulbifer thermotolerans]
MKAHTVEKIGGTSMSDYAAVRNNIILKNRGSAAQGIYQRIFVVSAYGGITDLLLEHKKSGKPGIFALFAGSEEERSWGEAVDGLRQRVEEINADLFEDPQMRMRANAFMGERLKDTERCLSDLERLCQHGHFALEVHLDTVSEMLASLGEAHSAWNTVQLLRQEGINARFVDLTGWHDGGQLDLDERIVRAFADIDLSRELPIVTGYAHTRDGLMKTFARGYSEMTFSRIAVLTGAREAIIHKEYHLSSADPRLVGEMKAVPIGRTNYDVADQLANLGMEAIHPRAAKSLRQREIPLRVMNTFEPEHSGTLVTGDYVSETPRVEIIAGRKNIYAVECFDQDMMGHTTSYDRAINDIIARFKGSVVTKDINANTITHFLANNLKTVKRIGRVISETFPDCDIQVRKVAVVSAIGSDMKVPGMLSRAVSALAQSGISILAVHQSMRQVDMQFVIDECDYEQAVKCLHQALVEVHDHGEAICAA